MLYNYQINNSPKTKIIDSFDHNQGNLKHILEWKLMYVSSIHPLTTFQVFLTKGLRNMVVMVTGKYFSLIYILLF